MSSSQCEVTTYGLRPTYWHQSVLATKISTLKAEGGRHIMLSSLPIWKIELGCRTEDVVAMLEYLVETTHPLVSGLRLDMHLIDAVIQCRLQRQGLYDRDEWTGTASP